MRRKDRELTDKSDIFDVVERCQKIHLAMVDEGKPYVVTLNFGYDREGDDLILYFHSAMKGRKMDVLRENPSVFFVMDTGDEFLRGSEEDPCAFCWRFDSVTGSGEVEFIEEAGEKAYALNRLIQHLDKSDKEYVFPEAELRHTCVYKLVSKDIAGKHHE